MKRRCPRRMDRRRMTRWDSRLFDLPDHVNGIAREERIGRNDWPSLFDALRYEQAVEGIAMVRRQGFSSEHMIESDGQNFDSVLSQLLRQIRSRGLGQRKSASLHLNQNLPHADHTHPEIIRSGIDLLSPARKLPFLRDRPQERVRIEKRLHL